ncbi:hypothetical protein JQ596_17120 [Bradyrhizobium manausense]|uniref:hypothetical protein n=1 Tax=Bradyrhizobium manausense TaxID=989370 RepID=UPI001BA4BF28|nr:hypothetical protein [Bradyrhizobium manausense]MBR0827248.1 hypothetical protein [Bradyrhizobium manausense]
MEALKAFIRDETLSIFRRRLADPDITEERRRMLTRLLALEEARDIRNEDNVQPEAMMRTARGE